jgi:nucleotide-binding universal stress UspA family protein
VLSVERPPEIAEDIETEALLEQAEAFFEKHFSILRERTGTAGVQAYFNVRVGHPAEQIVLGAEGLKPDLIITVHRGRGVFHRWLMGSVSRLVIAYAHRPVMAVRSTEFSLRQAENAYARLSVVDAGEARVSRSTSNTAVAR